MATLLTDNAVRLEDWAKISNNVITQGLIANLYETDSILKDVPFKEDPAFKATGVRIDPGSLPQNPTYGTLNTTPDSVRTVPSQHEERGYLIRENVKMDRRYRKNKNYIVDPVKVQTMGVMEMWARQLNTDFILNDPSSATGKKNGPDGLYTRLLAANQAKYGTTAENLIDAANGGSAFTISDTMAKADALRLFVSVDKMLQFMNAADGTGVVLYMNDNAFRKFSMAGKLCDGGGGFDTTKDEYDRTIMTYKNARLRDVGRKLDDTTRIIGNTENANGIALTGSTFTSIYGVRYGGMYLTGWHDGALDLEYIGTDPTGVQDIWLLDYLFGFYHGHGRSVARLFNINTV